MHLFTRNLSRQASPAYLVSYFIKPLIWFWGSFLIPQTPTNCNCIQSVWRLLLVLVAKSFAFIYLPTSGQPGWPIRWFRRRCWQCADSRWKHDTMAVVNSMVSMLMCVICSLYVTNCCNCPFGPSASGGCRTRLPPACRKARCAAAALTSECPTVTRQSVSKDIRKKLSYMIRWSCVYINYILFNTNCVIISNVRIESYIMRYTSYTC